MTRAYWNSVAADYEGAVLSVFDHDHTGLVRERIAAAGRDYPGGRAADLGCGVGKFTRLLAEAFPHVEACDWSAVGVQKTRAQCADLSAVTFSCFDLAADEPPFAPVDFALCVNVLLMPDMDERLRAWRTVTNQVAHGGQLLLVVPSLESILFSYFADLETSLDAGEACAGALQRQAAGTVPAADLHQGVHALRGVRTKHYLREELEHMLPARECDVLECVKLTYPDGVSTTWDWLVTARRR